MGSESLKCCSCTCNKSTYRPPESKKPLKFDRYTVIILAIFSFVTVGLYFKFLHQLKAIPNFTKEPLASLGRTVEKIYLMCVCFISYVFFRHY